MEFRLLIVLHNNCLTWPKSSIHVAKSVAVPPWSTAGWEFRVLETLIGSSLGGTGLFGRGWENNGKHPHVDLTTP